MAQPLMLVDAVITQMYCKPQAAECTFLIACMQVQASTYMHPPACTHSHALKGMHPPTCTHPHARNGMHASSNRLLHDSPHKLSRISKAASSAQQQQQWQRYMLPCTHVHRRCEPLNHRIHVVLLRVLG